MKVEIGLRKLTRKKYYAHHPDENVVIWQMYFSYKGLEFIRDYESEKEAKKDYKRLTGKNGENDSE